MKLGLLTDIHEDFNNLTWALKVLREHQVSRYLVLGDIFESAKNIDATVQWMNSFKHERLFGNHDLGLCIEPEPATIAKYSKGVLDFFASCEARIVLEDLSFTHGMPDWDARDPVSYYIAEPVWRAEARQTAFASQQQRVFFMGHFHQWALYDTRGQIEWDGTGPIILEKDRRYIVALNAVLSGSCATYDVASGLLTPLNRSH